MTPKVDLLRNTDDRHARRTTALIAVVFTFFVGLLSLAAAQVSYQSSTRGTTVLSEVTRLPGLASIRRLVTGEKTHAEETPTTPDGRLNILLTGVGGAGHDGAELTDTIILASLDTTNNRVAMISVPRDLAYPLGEGRFQKINAVNTYAEIQHPGEGARYAGDAIGNLFGVRIDRVLKIDFKGFEKFIDAIGGVDVVVERSFVDTSYPTNDERWQTISFKAGPQHLSGAQALIFVRSRHGNNGEGSDFARGRRQQIVLAAVREKLFSLGTLSSPNTMANLWSLVSSHIQTDITIWDAIKLAPSFAHLDASHITSHVLTDAPNGQLVAANVGGAFMLFPRKPDWSEIRTLAQDPFPSEEERSTNVRPASEIKIEIKNGTSRTGLAALVSGLLKKDGYGITGIENAAHKGYERTVIFDLTNGQKSKELVKLKNTLGATIGSVPEHGSDRIRTVYTETMDAEPVMTTSSDFLIILGESSAGLIGSVPNDVPDPPASTTTP